MYTYRHFSLLVILAVLKPEGLFLIAGKVIDVTCTSLEMNGFSRTALYFTDLFWN